MTLRERIYFMNDEIQNNHDQIAKIKKNQVQMGKAFEKMQNTVFKKLDDI